MLSCNEGESHSYYGRLEMDFGRNEIFNVPPVHFIQLTLAMSVSTRNFTAFSFFRGVQFDSKASTQLRGIYNLVFQRNGSGRQAFNVQYHYQSLLMTCSTCQKQLSEILVSTTAPPRRPPFLTVNLIGVKEEGEGGGGSPQLHSLAGEGSLITKKKVGRAGDDEVRRVGGG